MVREMALRWDSKPVDSYNGLKEAIGENSETVTHSEPGSSKKWTIGVVSTTKS